MTHGNPAVQPLHVMPRSSAAHSMAAVRPRDVRDIPGHKAVIRGGFRAWHGACGARAVLTWLYLWRAPCRRCRCGCCRPGSSCLPTPGRCAQSAPAPPRPLSIPHETWNLSGPHNALCLPSVQCPSRACLQPHRVLPSLPQVAPFLVPRTQPCGKTISIALELTQSTIPFTWHLVSHNCLLRLLQSAIKTVQAGRLYLSGGGPHLEDEVAGLNQRQEDAHDAGGDDHEEAQDDKEAEVAQPTSSNKGLRHAQELWEAPTLNRGCSTEHGLI